MQIYKDGRIAHYKKIFPNFSFPSTGPSDNFLTEQQAYKVSSFRPYDRETQKLVPCSPLIENGFAYVVEVQDMTEEEIAAYAESQTAMKAGEVRNARNLLIKASDWTQLADSPLSAEDKSAWATYRQALRDIPSQEGFPTTVEWPLAPGEEAVSSPE